MELKVIASLGDECCNGQDCPTVYTTETGSVVVQGVIVDGAPQGEGRVEIPSEFFLEAARRLQ